MGLHWNRSNQGIPVPSGLSGEACEGPPLGRASEENTKFPKLLCPAAPVRWASIVASACFLRVRDLICLVKGSVTVRLTAGNELC